MEISRDHVKALIHNGPCERAREAQSSWNPSLPGLGICPYCDLVRMLKQDNTPEHRVPITEEKPRWWQFKKKEAWERAKITFEFGANPDGSPKGAIPLEMIGWG
jgi:hypothetical protein